MLPGGLQFHWANLPPRKEWAKDPTDYEKQELLAWDFARSLPVDQLSLAVKLVPQLDKEWLKSHIIWPEDGGDPIYRYTDPDTGEVTERPAVVERTIAEEPRSLPIMVVLPPEEPLRYEIIYPGGAKSKSIAIKPEAEAAPENSEEEESDE
jgi:hypothetical protein